MELVVHKISGEATDRKVILDDSIFGIVPSDHAIYLDTKQYLANQRQGTHDSKEKSDLTGSTRKIKRQKGTGTARAGSIKSPIFKGGARVFGPHPRYYGFKLNKKVKRLARKSALTYMALDNNILVLEDFNLETSKTKDFRKILNNLGVDNKRTLMIIDKTDENIYLSARNIQKTKVIRAEGINTYEVLYANKIILVESAVKTIVEVFANK
ncbi:MAG: 50S ribosomal protein L4 [Bacteroidetes bacterium GWF2_41_31]|nr:MAG: 50S ribosomal protein L4 [Bacteroidetes bacterium GWF2_41_31]PIQ26507.1 MAG: 50S ribosomal protein L4 [Bacteroidetes bacterium CG18_big_fil_WC_8_21_14_2_50_41_14]PIY34181.1 MAG: 50S ribosomal protein L4 [Bacteroidetes bacterium CG_4_10_14_3_um_filter_42_6]PJB59071.1 MAG: 50S ribosomal protein L4 [Bacteroidetes bacterium CG_4_9_14_3_um_filter_41_19]